MRRVNISVNKLFVGGADGEGDREAGYSTDAGPSPLSAVADFTYGFRDQGYEQGGRKGGSRPRVLFRIHKFVFEWELSVHIMLCIASIAIPFSVSGIPWLAAIPLTLWLFYNTIFCLGAKRVSSVFPSFDRFKRNLVSSMEEFLPPRLLPVLSTSFISVVLATAVTAAKLGGPPLCLSSCHKCLSSWSNAVPAEIILGAGRGDDSASAGADLGGALIDGAGTNDTAAGLASGVGGAIIETWANEFASMGVEYGGHTRGLACGYRNGKQLLAYYTISQSANLIYLAVMIGLLTCLAWKVSDEELAMRQGAEAWLKAYNPAAYDMREQMIHKIGRPGTAVRPEGSATWLAFGFVAALTFTLIGWRKWGDLSFSPTAVVVVGVNVLVIFVSVLLLHVGFYGRLIALYQGNLRRVQILSKIFREKSAEMECGASVAHAWWALRGFVLSEDLSLDYDIGGLGVSATFFIVLISFVVALVQIWREGLNAILSPPGSYCAYASVYLTACLIRIFSLATKTYLEQQSHLVLLQQQVDEIRAVMDVGTSTASYTTSSATSTVSLPTSTSAGGSGTGGGGASGAGLHQSKRGRASSSASNSDYLMDDEGSDYDGGGYAQHTPITSSSSSSATSTLQAFESMMRQVKDSDPYPCVLGIPVKPALFATSKIYVFLCFAVISTKLMYNVVSALLS